jgi:uncharacterized ferritin-like protein (DUF455 family)
MPESLVPSAAITTSDHELRRQALYWLAQANADAKAAGVILLRRQRQQQRLPLAADSELASGLASRVPLPGRPPVPLLVAPLAVRQRSMRTPEGRVALIHALAHIEFNAINLALDALWRFAGLPAAYYDDWLQVAAEEALHFSLLRDHLQTFGYRYGDFTAHNSLWDMAEKTRHDVLARMALVPRTLEARGLDASPAVRAKLQQAGDTAAAAILDRILQDEIGHVAIGNHWFGWLCAARGLEPLATYAELARCFNAPPLRGPFNLAARRAAGFSEAELMALGGGTG